MDRRCAVLSSSPEGMQIETHVAYPAELEACRMRVHCMQALSGLCGGRAVCDPAGMVMHGCMGLAGGGGGGRGGCGTVAPRTQGCRGLAGRTDEFAAGGIFHGHATPRLAKQVCPRHYDLSPRRPCSMALQSDDVATEKGGYNHASHTHIVVTSCTRTRGQG